MKIFFSKHGHISFQRSFNADHFLLKDHDLKIANDIFFNFVKQKYLKQGTNALHCKYKFIIIHRSFLRIAETKTVSFYKIGNLLYETKVIGVTKLFKSYVKTKSFLWLTVNMSGRNILLATKLA